MKFLQTPQLRFLGRQSINLLSSILYPKTKFAIMQIASILSDLTSLRVCVRTIAPRNWCPSSNNAQDHSAALALVSTRAPASNTESSNRETSTKAPDEDDDPDMQRALDLMELHNGVKMKHVQGENQGLMQARKDVDTVLAKLESSAREQGVGRQ